MFYFAKTLFIIVISTQVFATISDPHAAAWEVRGVLKPDGWLRSFESFRSGQPLPAALRDAVTPVWQKFLGGGQPNRDIIRIFRDAGLEILETVSFRGTFLLYGIARPM